MLDDVQRGRFPEQPSGKDSPPFVRPRTVGRPLVDQQLDKGSLFRSQFPGRGSFACAQPDLCPADAYRLAWPQFKVTRQTVPLVEEAERRHAFGHRRTDLLCHRSNKLLVGRGNLGFFRCLACCLLVNVIAEQAAAGQGEQCCSDRDEGGLAWHRQSASAGLQGS